MRASIIDVEKYLPDQIIDNDFIEDKLTVGGVGIVKGTIHKLVRNVKRRFASKVEMVSDLAVSAAKPILQRNPNTNIDLLIFAAASSDLIEPATANIIQYKLGLQCPVFDIKNACNSFVTAMEIASSFINQDKYSNILIVNGEKLSEVIRYNCKDQDQFDQSLVAYSVGDVGAAMLMSKSIKNQVIFSKSMSWGEHWELCSVKGGGSISFRDMEAYYFEGNPMALKYAFANKITHFINNSLQEAQFSIDKVSYFLTHQVSTETITQLSRLLGIHEHKIIMTFDSTGNIAAATIPVSLRKLWDSKPIHDGDYILILGLAAGISITIQIIKV